MPRVRPFRAVGYAQDRFGSSAIPERIRLPGEPATQAGRVADLTDLACPPYDVIDEEQRRRLLVRNPHNAVRLELSAEPHPHAAAAETLRAWLAEGTLAPRPAEELFAYAHARPQDPDTPSVRGILARILLEPYGEGVRAHEHTMPGPRADRLALLRATGTQLSPILAVYFDGGEGYEPLMGLAWTDEWRARDGDGLLHRLAAIEADEAIAAYLSSQPLYIADGHHRYETALAFQREVRSDPGRAAQPLGSLAADWMMAVLVNGAREPLEIRATHRLIRAVDPDRLRALARQPDPILEPLPVPPDELAGRLDELNDLAGPVFGLALADGPGTVEGWLLVADPDAVADRMRREREAPVVRELDLAALQAIVLGDQLGLDPAADAGDRILYTKDPADALARVRSGDVQAALLVRPTRLDQMAAVASAGAVMPEKSTYFYPKLLTGLAFYPVEEG